MCVCVCVCVVRPVVFGPLVTPTERERECVCVYVCAAAAVVYASAALPCLNKQSTVASFVKRLWQLSCIWTLAVIFSCSVCLVKGVYTWARHM